MSTVKKVDILTSQIIEDLAAGLTWLKRDDNGLGSIQEKYGATDLQIQLIRKHPRLKDLEPSQTIFNLIDDLADEVQQTTGQTGNTGVAATQEPVPAGVENRQERNPVALESGHEEVAAGVGTDDVQAFLNL